MRYYGDRIGSSIFRSLSILKRNSRLDTITYGINSSTIAKGEHLGLSSDSLRHLRFLIKDRNNSMLSRIDELMKVLPEMYTSTDRTLEDVLAKTVSVNQKIVALNKSLDNVYEALSTVRANKGYLNKTEIDALVEACNETRDMFLMGFREKVMTTGTDKESLKEYEKEFDLLGLASESDETKSELLNIIVKISGLGLDPETEDEMANRVFDESIVKAVRSGDKTEIDKALKDKFASDIKDNLVKAMYADDAEDYFDHFVNNCSMEELFQFVPVFFDTVKTFEGMDREAQVDFMVRFAMAGEGYSGPGGASLENYIGAYFGRSGINWCAMYTIFCMKFSGFLNSGESENSIVPGCDITNVFDKEWSRVVGIKNSFPAEKVHMFYTEPNATEYNENYKPKIGDFILCHKMDKDGAINHIAIVVGVDEDKIYTIEGNRHNGINYAVYDMAKERAKSGDWDVVGFLEMGGTKEDMSYLSDDIVQRAEPDKDN